MRHASPLLLALFLSLPACKEEPVPQAPTPVLVEDGDWNDTGAFAPCLVVTRAPCGARNNFESGACDPASLAAFDTESAYTMHVRVTRPAYAEALGFIPQAMLPSASDAGTAGGYPLTEREVTPSSFFLTSQHEDLQGRVIRRTYLGCRQPTPGHLQGCYVECTNDTVAAHGTFDAWKFTPAANEPVASGLEQVSETRMDLGTPADVYVTHGHAYVVSLRGGLYVYDVRDPAHPVLTAHVFRETDNYWNGVWAKDNALYVASAARGVLVFDLQDPAHPVLAGAAPTQSINVHTLYITENLLLAASSDPDGVVLVFDITQPLRPVLLSQFQANGFNPSRSYGPHDMFAFERRLYVNYWGAGYVVASLEDPTAPVELGRFRYEHSTSHANAVGRIQGRLIGFEGGEDWGAHLRVLDLTDPAAPRRIGEHQRSGHVSIHNMVLVGTRLYVAWYHEGVRVLDVAEPEHPREVAWFNTFRATDPERGVSFYEGTIGIRVPGDGYVYAVDTSRGLLVLREQ
ncbi:hypothetical protein JGU66_10145 [Myxococcaceae bacterium JPH2]|nr:hypothetical protein [Myxococcaceae bacterium JPH2]